MTTSIVVATYNGEKYLREQMDSLRGQTLTPDEVLFFDDCSADGTVGLIEDYISRYNLKNWKVNVNPANKGYRLNFLEGAEQATGDIIFYCDQDDIWKDDKVEKIVRCFENPDVMVCAHESSRFNSHGTDEYKLVNKQGGGVDLKNTILSAHSKGRRTMDTRWLFEGFTGIKFFLRYYRATICTLTRALRALPRWITFIIFSTNLW